MPQSVDAILQSVAEQRRLLLTVAQARLDVLSPDELVQKILEALRQVVAYQTGTLFWLKESEQVLASAVYVGPPEFANTPRQWSIPLNHQPTQEIVTSGQARCVNHASFALHDLFPPGFPLRDTDYHLIYVPVHAQGYVVGIVMLIRPFAPFAAEEFELAQLFVSQCEPAVENARRYEYLGQYTAELMAQIQQRTAELTASNLILQQQNDHLSAQHDLTLALLNHRPLGDLLQLIISSTTQLSRAQHGYLMLAEGDALVLRATTDEPALAETSRRIQQRGVSPLMWLAYETHQPQILDDYINWPQPLNPDTRHHYQTAVAIPIIAGGACAGVIGLGRLEAHRAFAPSEIQLAAQFTQFAALAIEHGQLHQQLLSELQTRQQAEAELRQHNLYLDALNTTALGLMSRRNLNELLTHIVTQATSLLGTEHGFLYLLDPPGETMSIQVGIGFHAERMGHHIKIGEGLSGVVWQTGQPLYVENYATWTQRLALFQQSRLHAVVGVPLKSETEVIGVLGVSYGDERHRFNAQQILLLQHFAQLAELALDNARLVDQTRLRITETAAVNEIASAVSQQLDFDLLLTTIYEQIHEVMSVDLFFVALLNTHTQLLDYVSVHEDGRHRKNIAEPPSGWVQQVLSSGEVIFKHRTPAEIESANREHPSGRTTASLVYVPLRLGERIIGVMSVQSFTPHVYHHRDLTLLLGIASHFSIALENARLYDLVKTELDERRLVQGRLSVQYAIARIIADALTLHEAAPKILQAICTRLEWDVGELWMVDSSAQVLRCWEIWHVPSAMASEFDSLSRQRAFVMGEGLPGRVWAMEEAVWVEDVGADPEFPRDILMARIGLRSAFSFPIVLSNEVLGVIEFFSRKTKLRDENLLQAMKALGSQIGQFIERRRAEDALRESEARLDYLFRHFVASNVAERLLAQREIPQLGGERREVTLLFADVRGYTNLAEKLAPEETMTVLNQHFAVIGRIIADYGGTINQYAGDSIMAIFNAPSDQADHAVRAVRAALLIQQSLASMTKPSHNASSLVLDQVGIGINTGPAVAGYLGFEDRFDYTAIGDTTNVAARLSGVASRGQVLIGPRTCEIVKSAIQVRDVGPVQLKGKSEPLHVYEAV